MNIDCSETYPHLNLFRKYFSLNIFNENDFKLDEDSNTFTLNNCWIIQSLGILKLFEDIDKNSVISEWEDRIHDFREQATLTDFEPYTKIESQEDQNEIDGVMDEFEQIKTWTFERSWYKLTNPSVYISYYGIQYFYDSLNNQTNKLELNLRKYKIVPETKVYFSHSEPHLSYDIIHGNSMGDVMYSAMQLYNNYLSEGKTDRITILITKQLKLLAPTKEEIELLKHSKSPKEEIKSYDNVEELIAYTEDDKSQLKSELFIPAILPLYGLLTSKYIEFFKTWIPKLNSTITSTDDYLYFGNDYFTQNLTIGLTSIDNPTKSLTDIIEYVKLTASEVSNASK